jgi:hypothetical protein
VLRADFFLRGELVFLQGYFEKTRGFLWCFCGENVVVCVVNVVI